MAQRPASPFRPGRGSIGNRLTKGALGLIVVTAAFFLIYIFAPAPTRQQLLQATVLTPEALRGFELWKLVTTGLVVLTRPPVVRKLVDDQQCLNLELVGTDGVVGHHRSMHPRFESGRANCSAYVPMTGGRDWNSAKTAIPLVTRSR